MKGDFYINGVVYGTGFFSNTLFKVGVGHCGKTHHSFICEHGFKFDILFNPSNKNKMPLLYQKLKDTIIRYRTNCVTPHPKSITKDAHYVICIQD